MFLLSCLHTDWGQEGWWCARGTTELVFLAFVTYLSTLFIIEEQTRKDKPTAYLYPKYSLSMQRWLYKIQINFVFFPIQLRKNDVCVSLRDGLIGWFDMQVLPEYKLPFHYLWIWSVSHVLQARISSSINEEEGGPTSPTEVLLRSNEIIHVKWLTQCLVQSKPLSSSSSRGMAV